MALANGDTLTVRLGPAAPPPVVTTAPSQLDTSNAASASASGAASRGFTQGASTAPSSAGAAAAVAAATFEDEDEMLARAIAASLEEQGPSGGGPQAAADDPRVGRLHPTHIPPPVSSTSSTGRDLRRAAWREDRSRTVRRPGETTAETFPIKAGSNGAQAPSAAAAAAIAPAGTAAAAAAITTATAAGPGPGSGRDVLGLVGLGLQDNTQHRMEPLGSVADDSAGTAAGGAAPQTRPATRPPFNPDAKAPGSAGDVASGAPPGAPRHAAAQQRKRFPPAAIDGRDRPAKRMSLGLEAAAVPGGSAPALAEEVGPGGPPPEPGLLPHNLVAAVELGSAPRPGLPVKPVVADAPQATAATEAGMRPAAAATEEAAAPRVDPPLPVASEARRAMPATAAAQVAASGTNVVFVGTWDEFEEALARSSNAGVATGAAPVSWVIDLQGALLEAPPPFDSSGMGQSRRCIITTRGLVLRNGELRLPAGWRLVVSAPEVQLLQLRVSGAGYEPWRTEAEAGLLVITGEHNSVRLEGCHVRLKPPPNTDRRPGVNVAGGASAHLQDCTIDDASSIGLMSCGKSSRVTATRCRVDGSHMGFAALAGSHMGPLVDCKAVDNGQDGYFAQDPGSILEVGSGCLAQHNGTGYHATCGGVVNIAAACRAVDNSFYGFLASEAGSKLKAGEGCSTVGGRAGFVAKDGGELTAGRSCIARKNAEYGFCAVDVRSQLQAGEGCCVEGAQEGDGFAAVDGGFLYAAAGCTAAACGRAGFAARHVGSRLVAGPGCISRGMKAEGYCAMGGRLRLGEGCIAEENKLDGFRARRDAVTIDEDASETASEDAGAGGRGCSPGVLDASAGKCIARANGGSGFCCEDGECVLMAGPGCIAEQNLGAAGFHVKGGGEMEVREGCAASGNTGWGLLAEGANSVLCLGPGHGEAGALHGNAAGTRMARDGAVLINL
ncbi:hypothetical protein PLESTM_000164800 [Pleodorina starrii]|nr:hypothetical protein PLESTM_000164800 [Pleodorina starrii]